MRKTVTLFLVVSSFTVFIQAKNYRWGWDVHNYINENAVDHLPPGMSFFQDHRLYLEQHSTDPDRDDLPGFYHYIDIDYYPEFFTGTLPSNWDDILALYGYEIVTTNGIIPWVIEWWTDSLSILMSSGQWDDVWQVAAELGHYVADSHQPLHLTLNYNGQLTDNHGIHRRYETDMTGIYLPQLPPPDDTVTLWENVIDSIFQYIDEFYPYVDSIISADDLATGQDPSYGTVYYDLLWAELDSITTETIQRAIIDLATVWYTAWIDAEKPIPPVESATRINVPSDQSTIQEGIDVAVDGDTVLVQPGTYVENINFNGKNIIVSSLFITTGDESYVSHTIIDGDSTGSVVTFENGEDSTSVFCGFTVTNGWSDNGGGIYCRNSSPSIINVTVINNTAENGGAISNYNYSDPIITNCTFANNFATRGGGIWNGNSSPIITSCIFWGNSPNEIDGDMPVVSYSNILGGYQGEGNIDIDPLFCNPDRGNYYLSSNSPCIGIGENGSNIGAFGIGCEVLIVDKPLSILNTFSLSQNYPNPFNPTTTIEFSIPQSGIVTLIVYDVLGREVETILNEYRDTGHYELQWNVGDVPSGVYFVRMKSGSFNKVRKAMVVR